MIKYSTVYLLYTRVEINPYLNQLKDLTDKHYGGIFDYDLKKERLEDVS